MRKGCGGYTKTWEGWRERGENHGREIGCEGVKGDQAKEDIGRKVCEGGNGREIAM